ncbi:MAG: hypothetical protein GSR79_04950 [Desulfurococcales archaeon]|nr:hypothetical protein [Desulfurococcales archaeon]
MKALYLAIILAIIAFGVVFLYEENIPSNNNLNISTTLSTHSSSYYINNATTEVIPEPVPSNRIIVLKASEENMSIGYIETLNYDNESFHIITDKWNQYVRNTKEEINNTYASRGAHIVDLTISYDKLNRSVIITFTVTNEMRIHGNKVVADFLWFLEAWNLDFINSHFMESSHGLIWRGDLKNIPTIIIVNVPWQREPYKAWGEPYGHCHGHIWWPVTNQTQHYNETSTNYNNILSKYLLKAREIYRKSLIGNTSVSVNIEGFTESLITNSTFSGRNTLTINESTYEYGVLDLWYNHGEINISNKSINVGNVTILFLPKNKSITYTGCSVREYLAFSGWRYRVFTVYSCPTIGYYDLYGVYWKIYDNVYLVHLTIEEGNGEAILVLVRQ